MKESLLVKIIKYGLYGATLVPLVIFRDFISPFHFGKIMVFRSLIEILLVFYIVLVWSDKSYLPKRDRIFWSLFAFTAIFGLTSLTSIQPYESFWGTLERMGGAWSFLHYFIFFVMLVSIFRTKNDWLRLLDVTIFVGLLSALYGFAQKTDIQFFLGSGDRARIFGTLGNAALFAGYELMILFLSATLFFKENNSKSRKIYYLTAGSIAGIAILMTAARGSILGLALGIFVFMLLFVWIYESKRMKNILLALVALGIILIGLSQMMKNLDIIQNSRYLKRISDISLQSYTVQTRFWAWKAGLQSWDDSFKTIILGWGPENFNIPFSKNFNPKFFTGPGSETLFDRAHNMFIEILVTMGIIGLLAYINIFAALFKSIWQKIKKVPKNEAHYYIGMFSLLVASIIHTTFFFDITANYILLITVMAFISFLSSVDHKTSQENKKLTSTQVLMAILLLLGAFWLINTTNIKPAKANYATTRAIVSGWAGDTDGAINKYKEALAYDTFGTYEYRHRFAQYVFENYTKIKDINYLTMALEEVKKNADSHPQDYLPHLYLARI